MPRRRSNLIPRSFALTMSMRTYNDIQTVLAHVEESTRGEMRRRSSFARRRLEKALKRADR